jgi:hypothetical protein
MRQASQGKGRTALLRKVTSISTSKDKTGVRRLAGFLTIFTSLLILLFGVMFLFRYQASIDYYHPSLTSEAIYLGVWYLATFAFGLVGGIFLLKKNSSSYR